MHWQVVWMVQSKEHGWATWVAIKVNAAAQENLNMTKYGDIQEVVLLGQTDSLKK